MWPPYRENVKQQEQLGRGQVTRVDSTGYKTPKTMCLTNQNALMTTSNERENSNEEREILQVVNCSGFFCNRTLSFLSFII